MNLQLKTFLGILTDTHNLTLATANATADVLSLVGLQPNGPGLSRAGPNSPRPIGPPQSPRAFEAFGCSGGGYLMTGGLVNQGLSTAVTQAGYDNSLFSYAGCRCNAGYDNVYNLSDTGRLHMCTASSQGTCALRWYHRCWLGCAYEHVALFVYLKCISMQICLGLT